MAGSVIRFHDRNGDDTFQEVEEDLPWNGYVAAAALGALLLLQLAAAALALLAARVPRDPRGARDPRAAAFSASRVSLVNSFR